MIVVYAMKTPLETPEEIAMTTATTPTTTDLPVGTWTIDPSHSVVGFSVRHMMVSKVRGRFHTFTATITTTDDPTGATLEASVDMASVDTGDTGRDEHLRTSDFFDIADHPTMTFRSTSLTGSGEEYQLDGDLTIRGVTRPVSFALEIGGVGKDPWGNTRAGFTATTSINRKDWGLRYNAALEGGGVLIGDKVTIELDVEAVLDVAAG
jgi:polyisoprenoid-binding protein YceI